MAKDHIEAIKSLKKTSFQPNRPFRGATPHSPREVAHPGAVEQGSSTTKPNNQGENLLNNTFIVQQNHLIT